MHKTLQIKINFWPSSITFSVTFTLHYAYTFKINWGIWEQFKFKFHFLLVRLMFELRHKEKQNFHNICKIKLHSGWRNCHYTSHCWTLSNIIKIYNFYPYWTVWITISQETPQQILKKIGSCYVDIERIILRFNSTNFMRQSWVHYSI
jgi:hypothetical protein